LHYLVKYVFASYYFAYRTSTIHTNNQCRAMLVPLESLEGRQRLKEVTSRSFTCAASISSASALSPGTDDDANHGVDCDGVVQLEVVESFRKQRGNTVCGLASLAIILTARTRRNVPRSSSNNNNSNGSAATATIDADSSSACASSTSAAHDCEYNKDEFCGSYNKVDEDDVYPMATTKEKFKRRTVGDDNNDGGHRNDSSYCSPIPSNPSAAAAAAVGVVSEEKIRTSGMTLDQVKALTEALPTTEKVVAIFAIHNNDNDSNSDNRKNDNTTNDTANKNNNTTTTTNNNNNSTPAVLCC